MKKFKLVYFLFVIMLILICVVSKICFSVETVVLTTDDTKLTKHNRLKSFDLVSELSDFADDYYSKNLLFISGKTLENKLESLFYISDVQVTKYYPKKLIIQITFEDFGIKCFDGQRKLVADGNSIFECSEDVYAYYKNLPEVVLDSTYVTSCLENGLDKGFVQMEALSASLISNNLITSIKYDNNNLSDFGRLNIKIDSMDTVLRVLEPVEPERLSQALEIVRSGTYDLYSGTLVKRRQEDDIGIR